MAWTTVAFAAGGIVALTAVLLGIGLRNPRVMLQDYPKDVGRRPAELGPGTSRLPSG